MSNRLEREFPPHRWQAVPPIRREPVPHAVAEHYLARGRQLQGAAIRRGVRAAAVGIVRTLAEFIRCGAHGIAKRAPEHDCRPAPGRGA